MDSELEAESEQAPTVGAVDATTSRRLAEASGVRVVVASELAGDPRLAEFCAGGPAASPPILSPASSAEAFMIGEHDGALDLRPPGEHTRRGIQAIFPPDKEPQRRGQSSAPRNPLIRAFGKRPIEILDVTAGLGGDAYRLARAGHRVTGLERAMAVFLLLESGWARAQARGLVPAEVAERLVFRHGDGRDAIAALEGGDRGVYIDPMYPPPKRRSAKPRRELQVLRALLGGQTDAAALVELARERAARVVVKRPHHAAPLADGASHRVETKLVRFDVYLNPGLLEARPDE